MFARVALSVRPRGCLAVGAAGCAQFMSDRCAPLFGIKGSSYASCSTAPESVTPLVLVGPSGVGKGTLIARLLKEYPDQFGFCVSTTTRGPRPGEVDGKDYNFSDKESMETAIKEGKYLEHANVHTNIYGTSIAALEAVQSEHKIAILDIDVQGARSVKAKIPADIPDAKFFFLAPPSMEVLEARLRGRGTETEHKIQVRLQNAIDEIEFSKTEEFFHLVVVADDGFATALPGVKKWLEEVYPHLKNAKRK